MNTIKAQTKLSIRHTSGNQQRPAAQQQHHLHSAGNQAVQNHFQRVSQPHEPAERNAHQLADQVMQTPYRHTSSQLKQPNNTNHNQSATGQPLPHSLRRFFEPRFGQNFDSVRIHDDSQAHQSAAAINAKAFTHGNHISFDKGQYAPHTTPGRHLIAHELAHVSQAASQPDTAYRETWDVDDSKRTVKRGVLVQLLFTNTWSDWYNNTGWTATRKNAFRTDFEQGIENRFNNSGIVLNPPASAADVLPADNISKGYEPKVDISLVPDGDTSVSEDWEIDVESNPSGGWRKPSSNRSYGDLNEASNKPVRLKSSAPGVKQNQAVHEFGHHIGLDHPGKGLGGGLFSSSKLSPGATEYSHTGTDAKGRTVDGPNDLMGGGMGMQPFYFDTWSEKLDEHIAALRLGAQRRQFGRDWNMFKRAIGNDPKAVGWAIGKFSGI